jgi:predicted Fe-Mo cluster-binding NifX family protein
VNARSWDEELENIRKEKREQLVYDYERNGGDTVTVRIVIPVLNANGLDASLSEHFGRAPYFLTVDLDDTGRVSKHETIINDSEHFGGVGLPPDRILQLHPKALITYGMGGRALTIFQSARVAVMRATSTKAQDVIKAYHNDELEELTEGCHQARHHE